MKTTKFAKFILWVLTLALAYAITHLLESLTLAKAFFGIHAILGGALLVTLLLICAFGKEEALKTFGKFLIRVLRFVVAMAINCIICYVATLIVTVDFFVAYLLITLGQSMFNVEYIEAVDFADFKEKFSGFKLFSRPGKNASSPFAKLGKLGKKENDASPAIVEEPVDYADADEFEEV